MKLSQKLLELKNNFCQARNTKLSDEEFAILLMTYPSFQVANADGNFDEDERDLLTTLLTNFLNEIYGDVLNDDEYENMITAFVEDFLWVNKHNEFRAKLLTGLKELCSETEGLADTIKGMMQEMAEVSEGMSQSEKDIIMTISDDLKSK